MKVPLYIDNKDTFLNNFSIKINYDNYYTKQNDPEGYYGLFGNPFYRVFDFKKDQEFYYYSVVISLSQVMDIIDKIIIPNSVLADIKQNKCKILLVSPFEGWSWDFWTKIVDKIKEVYHLTDDRFVVLDANLKKHKTIKSVYYNFWERSIIYNQLESKQLSGIDKIDNEIKREKKFIYLNRRPHAGRIAAVTLMEKYRDQGYLSLGLNGQMHQGYYEYQESIFKDVYSNIYTIYQKNKIKEKLPFQINDGVDAEIENPVYDKSVDKFYNSYLHIVAETYQIEDPKKMFFSEKIFKPMQFMQPFVLLGQKHSLKYLRSFGYKTFSNIFDESYDEIENDEERLLSAFNTIENIIKKTDEELNELMQNALPILNHNISCLQYRCIKNDIDLRDKLLELLNE